MVVVASGVGGAMGCYEAEMSLCYSIRMSFFDKIQSFLSFAQSLS